MSSKLIAYVCVAETHRPSSARLDKLTIHDRSWAFCPYDAMADGHLWQATGGADYEMLIRAPEVAVVA